LNISDVLGNFELSFLREAAALVDSKLAQLDMHARASDDPDGSGIFDEAEYISGFGLVACQAYVTGSISRSNFDKREALALGPKHACGHSISYLVNAGANYWKHSSEWDHPLSKRAQETANAVSSLGVDLDAPYVIVNALAEILRPGEPRIERLIPFLSQWHAALQSDA
jgi:hypothetical protein